MGWMTSVLGSGLKIEVVDPTSLGTCGVETGTVPLFTNAQARVQVMRLLTTDPRHFVAPRFYITLTPSGEPARILDVVYVDTDTHEMLIELGTGLFMYWRKGSDGEVCIARIIADLRRDGDWRHELVETIAELLPSQSALGRKLRRLIELSKLL